MVCLLPFIVLAQSIENENVDPFTGDSIVVTSWTNVDVKSILPLKKYSRFYFMLIREGEKVFFHIKIYDGKINKINKDSKLQFKMKDNSLITLDAADTFIAETEVYTALEKSYSRNVMHAVYVGDLSLLVDGNYIEKIRLNISWGSFIFELNEKNAKKINKAYKLIMQN